VYTYDKAYNYSSALVGSQATAAIPATTATAATSINSTGFIANWDAGVGASGYRLDVSIFDIFGTTSQAEYNEGFNNGVTAPTNWVFTNIGGTYITSINSGLSTPSLQMDNTNDRIQTTLLSGDATQLSFWIKGISTDASSSLSVEGYNGNSWISIQNITNSLPTSGTTFTYNANSNPQLPTGLKQFRFTYTKSAGNIAFDDLSVLYNVLTPSYYSFFGDMTVSGTSRNITGLAPSTTYYYRVRATSPSSTSTNSNVISVTTLAKYTIAASSNDGAKGSASGGMDYDAGANVSLTATPTNASYRFVNWTESGNFVSSANPYTFTASAGRTLVANFADMTAPIDIATSTNASTFAACTTCDVTVASGATLTI
ncbi:hypothetical protein JZU68_01870, partial [bacterium]|nr:hypothetical protein [bacterium]